MGHTSSVANDRSPLTPVERTPDRVRGFAPGELQGLYRFSMIPAFTARLNLAQLAKLEGSPSVLSIGGNPAGSGALAQSNSMVGANLAHQAGVDGEGVIVAVLDTGIDSDHPDFEGALVEEQCFCQGPVLGDGVGW